MQIASGKVKLKDLIFFPGDYEIEDFKKEEDEADEEFSLRLLGMMKYKFVDLKLSKKHSSRAAYMIQKNIYGSLKEFIKYQPTSQKAVMNLGLKPIVNLLGYYPPTSYGYFEMGSYFELGYSTDFYNFTTLASPVKLNMAVATQGHDALFSGKGGVSSFTPSLGLEFNIYPISKVSYQFNLGIRAGYMFARSDSYGTGECNKEAEDEVFSVCSKYNIQLYPIITLFDRFRIKPMFQYFPTTNQLIFSFGVGLNLSIEY